MAVKEIGVSALVSILCTLSILGGVNILDDGSIDISSNSFYCQAEESIRECISIGGTTRCYLNEEKSKWDYCSSGWESIVNDIPAVQGRQWECSPKGCVEK